MPTLIDQHLAASNGYAELGMSDDAHQELDCLLHIPDAGVSYAMAKVCLYALEERWDKATHYTAALCILEPRNGDHFLNHAALLRRLDLVGDAADVLVTGPLELTRISDYHYQLARYQALLGEPDSALTSLHRAVRLDGEVLEKARTERDLASIQDRLPASPRSVLPAEDVDCPF